VYFHIVVCHSIPLFSNLIKKEIVQLNFLLISAINFYYIINELLLLISVSH
jgi:hypothetical protein